jgi:hypothetical protein
MAFNNLKLWLVDWSGLSRDALHIYVAIALFLLVRMLWRGWGGTLAALILVLTVALTGEWLDHQFELMNAAACDWAEHMHDLRNTLAAPLVLALTLPLLRPRRAKKAEAEISGENAERGLEQA